MWTGFNSRNKGLVERVFIEEQEDKSSDVE